MMIESWPDANSTLKALCAPYNLILTTTLCGRSDYPILQMRKQRFQEVKTCQQNRDDAQFM